MTGLEEARTPYNHPAAELSLAARIAAGSALVLGSGCQVVAFLLIPHNEDTTAWLTWIAENESRGQLSKMFDVLAMPFLIASAAVYIMLREAALSQAGLDRRHRPGFRTRRPGHAPGLGGAGLQPCH